MGKVRGSGKACLGSRTLGRSLCRFGHNPGGLKEVEPCCAVESHGVVAFDPKASG